MAASYFNKIENENDFAFKIDNLCCIRFIFQKKDRNWTLIWLFLKP